MTTDISTIEQELTAALEKAVPHITTAYSTTLEDVLRALQKMKRFGSSTATYFDLNDVGFEFGFTGTTNWTIWECGKPLSEQSEETKRFLHSLLV